jgi:hypothetical protein
MPFPCQLEIVLRGDVHGVGVLKDPHREKGHLGPVRFLFFVPIAGTDKSRHLLGESDGKAQPVVRELVPGLV